MRKLAILLLVALSGCQSFSSTSLHRMDDNTLVGDSNGKLGHHDQAKPYKGIPITLKIPTHLDVFVDEVFYLEVNGRMAKEPLDGQCRLLNVRTAMIKTEKVFTVDFKRPGAGILDLDITFSDQQYFDKIVSKLEDETITQAAGLVSSIIDSVQAFSTSAPPNEKTLDSLAQRGIHRETRVVAYQRFDINSPTFECDVEQFVNQHLNACNQCSTLPTYDIAPAP